MSMQWITIPAKCQSLIFNFQFSTIIFQLLCMVISMSKIVCYSNWKVSADKSSEYSPIFYILCILLFKSKSSHNISSNWPSWNKTAIFNGNSIEIKDKRMTSWNRTPLQSILSLVKLTMLSKLSDLYVFVVGNGHNLYVRKFQVFIILFVVYIWYKAIELQF